MPGDALAVRLTIDVTGLFLGLSEGSNEVLIGRNDSVTVLNRTQTLFDLRPADFAVFDLAGFRVGDKLSMTMQLHAKAFATNEHDQADYRTGEADLGNSGHLYLDVLSGNASFVSASGHLYGINDVPAVPEPTIYAMFIFGLGALLWWKRRERPDAMRAQGVRTCFRVATLIAALGLATLGHMAFAHDLAEASAPNAGPVKPSLILRDVVSAMPTAPRQEVRVLTASFKPGESTVTHTHRFPVTVYVLQGAFTLELDGRAPVTIKAGEALVEPPQTKMTGYNRGSGDLKVVIFYASDIDTSFLDPVQ